jgi:hypothetical protein
MAAVCREEQADYRTYLLRLAELEAIDRERRAAERRIRAAPGASAPDVGPATALPGSSRW